MLQQTIDKHVNISIHFLSVFTVTNISHACLAQYFINYHCVLGAILALIVQEVGGQRFQSMDTLVVPLFHNCEEYRIAQHLRFYAARAARRCSAGPLTAADEHIVILTMGELAAVGR